MESLGEEPHGHGWQPATSGNGVSWDGEAVVKRFVRPCSLETEKFVINSLGGLPVPRLLADAEPGTLRMRFVEGLPGREAVEAGMAGKVLLALGEFLLRLHQLDTAPYSGELHGVGEVLVHGDFAHYNCLFETESGKLAAVLDWEGAYLGDRFTDLAWCEFQFRNRFPQQAWAVQNLFQGYGSEPPNAEREMAVQAD